MPLRHDRPSPARTVAVTGRLLRLGAFFLGLASSAGVADAQPRGPLVDAPEPATTATGIVEIIVAPKGDDLAKIQQVIGPRAFGSMSVRWSSISRFEVNALFQHAQAESGTTIRAWIDLSVPTMAHLYFANRASERFLVREVALSPAFDEVDREALGQVLELSVAALLDDVRAGLSRKETESVLAAQGVTRADRSDRASRVTPADQGGDGRGTATPDRPSVAQESAPGRSALEATVFYAASVFSSDVPFVHGPGVSLAWSLLGDAPRIAFFGSGQYHLPETFDGDRIGVELEAAVLRGGMEVSTHVGGATDSRAFGSTFITGQLGLGADITRVTPLPGALDPSASLTAPYSSSELAMMATFGLTVAMSNRIDLSMRLLVDIYLTRARYDLEDASNVSTVLSPRVVRPGLLAGVVFK